MKDSVEGPTYWQHKCKCMACGLHFIVCSDYEGWPGVGTTREQKLGEATGVIHCPECGSISPVLHWKEQAQGFIFQSVPGHAEMVEFKR